MTRLGAWLAYKLFNNPAWKLYQSLLKDPDLTVFYPSIVKYHITIIGEQEKETKIKKKGCLLTISEKGLIIYPFTQAMQAGYSCKPHQLQWFGRPLKYESGSNEIIIHSQIDDKWLTVNLWLDRHYMQQLVRKLKIIATPEQITAYRRRRPYIHYGPLAIEPAEQEITGEWKLQRALTLYVTPGHLIFLKGTDVLRIIPMEQIQEIQALRRIDAPQENGLVRFLVEGQTIAFATPDNVQLGNAIAEAAKRTLEEPILQKRKSKKKDEGEEEWNEEDEDWEEWD